MLKAKMFALVAATVALIVIPFASNAAQDVTLDSSLNVANVTAGGTQYTPSVNAKVDDVVKVELYIHNTQLPDSGLVANNVKASIVIPTAAGTTQTLKSTVSADNSNTVSSTATVNLSLATANLQYVPGSATWTHNVGTNTNIQYQTDKIGDAVVSGGEVLGNQNPCFNFESYVTVLVRVMAPAVSITKQVRVDGTKTYATSNTANPGDTLDYVITVANQGNTTLKGVVIGDNMPPYLSYIAGTTYLVDSNTPTTGTLWPDGITTHGITVDDLAPGGTELVYFKLKLASNIPCGNHPLVNVGTVTANGINQFYNNATTTVNVACTPVTPVKPVTPVTPTTSTSQLPDTGAGALAGVGGIGSIAYAGRAYLRSKKSLVDALRK